MREAKQQPSRAGSGHQISCCLVSLHFLCDILSDRPVIILRTAIRNLTVYSRAEERAIEGDPLVYIVAVLLFYSAGMAALLINYMKKVGNFMLGLDLRFGHYLSTLYDSCTVLPVPKSMG